MFIAALFMKPSAIKAIRESPGGINEKQIYRDRGI